MNCIFPGSFNPWHKGHNEVIYKALQVFDTVVVAQGYNPNKKEEIRFLSKEGIGQSWDRHKLIVDKFDGRLVDYIHKYNYLAKQEEQIHAIVKGLRNAQDLEYETTQQYWNEDLGITLPVFYIIAGRDKRHISSSAIRLLEKFK